LEFEPEPVHSAVVAGKVKQTKSPASGTPADAWTPESFFSENIEAFASETSAPLAAARAGAEPRPAPELFGDILAARSRSWSGGPVAAAGLVVLVAVGVPTSRWLLVPAVPAIVTGTLVIVTNPPGATVVIDGTRDGTTPLNRKIAAGSHTVTLRGAGASRTMAVNVSAGGQAFQYIELAGAAADVGQLDVRSEPSGAFVTIDGVARGVTPIVADLAPGEHTVMLAGNLGWATQGVTIESGVKSALTVAKSSWSIVAP
jgi:hypothetical protein